MVVNRCLPVLLRIFFSDGAAVTASGQNRMRFPNLIGGRASFRWGIQRLETSIISPRAVVEHIHWTQFGIGHTARCGPLEKLLLETDAPYLAPVPHRGKRNEPAFTALMAAKVAEEQAESNAKVSSASSANSRRLFSGLT